MTEVRQLFTGGIPMIALDIFPGKYTGVEFVAGRAAEFH